MKKETEKVIASAGRRIGDEMEAPVSKQVDVFSKGSRQAAAARAASSMPAPGKSALPLTCVWTSKNVYRPGFWESLLPGCTGMGRDHIQYPMVNSVFLSVVETSFNMSLACHHNIPGRLARRCTRPVDCSQVLNCEG